MLKNPLKVKICGYSFLKLLNFLVVFYLHSTWELVLMFVIDSVGCLPPVFSLVGNKIHEMLAR